ncbi:hypothetical protein BJX68DRAFT_225214 [Aspergillus pseudodeflectus]|uniref:Uncharacterized protein n=1 Tax=Aspergillus pseudodeflectus TaxID=176178 RepID=A0ABR4L7J9_9EURO
MSQTSIHTSPLKDSRRILGEKNVNACLSPAARSPVKRAPVDSSSPKKLLPSPSFIAQKRPIGQVDEKLGNDARGLLRFQRVETRVPAAVAPAQHGIFEQLAADGEVRPTSDVMNLDEQTEKPLPQIDTSSYAGNPFSEAQPISIQSVPSDPDTRKQFIKEKATLLRNRLQNAMRHVRDPQFDRRVSELEAHSRKYPRLSGSGIQQHLEQKYGTGKEDDDEDDDDDDQMLSTPRAQISRLHHVQEPAGAGDGEVTPTQNTFQQDQHAASPSQMLLSSPTYKSNPATTAQSGRLNCQSPQKTAEDTSPSSQRSGHEGDGDAVDGLLKLMGTTPNSGAGSSGYEKPDC